MATETRYLYGPGEMSHLGNQTLDTFIDTMVQNDIIDKDKAKEMLEYRVVFSRRGFFGKMISHVLYKNENSIRMNIVKLMDSEEDE